MTTWFSSDPHFGHRNIVDYTGRPFRDAAGEPDAPAMDAALVEAWNARVAPSDDVWLLGDIAFGDVTQSLSLIARLHGRIALVWGNHDRGFSGRHKVEPGAHQRYLDAGFVEIHDEASVAIGGQLVVLSHFPYDGDSHGPDRYVDHRPVDRGGWVVHGHVHREWRQRGRQINVGVDAWAGRPVALEEVAELIAAGPCDLPPLPWLHDDQAGYVRDARHAI